MLHQLLIHWKVEAAAIAVATGIGLLANQFTAPKVLAVMVFLSDWNMLWTWEWWLRMIICLVIGTAIWWLQKRKHEKEMTTMEKRCDAFQRELNHTQVLLAAAQTRLDIKGEKR